MKILYKIRKFLFGSKIERTLKNDDSIYFKVLDFFSNLYTDLIIVPYETTWRFCYWGWKLRDNYEFQCEGIYYMIYLQLKAMIDYSKEHAHLCWNSNYESNLMRDLRTACNLAKRLSEDSYHTNMDQHDKKWGKNNMVFREDHTIVLWREKAWNPELEEKEHKEWQIAYKLDEKQEQFEKKYLYKLLEKHLESWWD